MKALIGIAQIIFLLSLISCKKNETPCLDCGDPKVKSAFDNQYFLAGYNSMVEPQLFLFDTLTNRTSTSFGFCPFTTPDEWNKLDIIKASGNILWACNRVDSFLQVRKFKSCDACPVPIPDINSNFDLKDIHWRIDSLKFNGAVFLPPCGHLPEFFFESNGNYFISLVANDMRASYSLTNGDSIKLTPGPFGLVVPKTGYEINFEQTFYSILSWPPVSGEPIPCIMN